MGGYLRWWPPTLQGEASVTVDFSRNRLFSGEAYLRGLSRWLSLLCRVPPYKDGLRIVRIGEASPLTPWASSRGGGRKIHIFLPPPHTPESEGLTILTIQRPCLYGARALSPFEIGKPFAGEEPVSGKSTVTFQASPSEGWVATFDGGHPAQEGSVDYRGLS